MEADDRRQDQRFDSDGLIQKLLEVRERTDDQDLSGVQGTGDVQLPLFAEVVSTVQLEDNQAKARSHWEVGAGSEPAETLNPDAEEQCFADWVNAQEPHEKSLPFETFRNIWFSKRRMRVNRDYQREQRLASALALVDRLPMGGRTGTVKDMGQTGGTGIRDSQSDRPPG